MSPDEARLNDYLKHMLEAIQRVELYTADIDLNAFLESTLIQDAVLRNLEIVWRTLRTDLPALQSTIEAALASRGVSKTGFQE